jgi:uncharacterized integral membrane protein
MELNQGKIYENLPMIMLMATLVLLQIVPDPFKGYMLIGGMVGSIGMMFFTEVILRVEASKYLHLRLIIRPSNKIVNFFISNPLEGIARGSRIVDETRDLYETPLDTQEKCVMPHYGIVTGITLQHEKTWEERMHFMPSKAIFRGYEVDHNASATITVWEKRDAPERLDHLEPRPTYVIAEAVQDYHILNHEPLTVEEEPSQELALTNGGESTSLATVQNQATSLTFWKKTALEYKTRSENEHQRTIRLESQVGQMKNEFHGLTGKEADTDKLVFERVHTMINATEDIMSLSYLGKKHNWFQITMNMVILILGLASIYELATNADLRTWIGTFQLPAIVIILGAVALYFYFQRRK